MQNWIVHLMLEESPQQIHTVGCHYAYSIKHYTLKTLEQYNGYALVVVNNIYIFKSLREMLGHFQLAA